MGLSPGLTAAVELLVGDEDTAPALRSGSVPVLATPRLVALCEEATMLALEGRLPDGQTSVGVRVHLDHLSPSSVGQTVRAEAHLEKVEGRRLVFTVSAKDSRSLLAAGRVTRVVVDPGRFLERCT